MMMRSIKHLILWACCSALPLAAAAQSPTPAQNAAPDAPVLRFVFEETVMLGEVMTPGATAMGKRVIIPITGGHFEGPGMGDGLRGQVMPGGWDWQLVRADGCVLASADYMLKTDDGVIINVVNRGPLCPGKPVRTTPVFEPPLGKYAWLGQSAFIGTLDVITADGKPAVLIRFYRAE